jgi:hypothetical protein
VSLEISKIISELNLNHRRPEDLVPESFRRRKLREAAEEISKYKLHLVGVKEVSCEGGGTDPACTYIYFFIERGMRIMN